MRYCNLFGLIDDTPEIRAEYKRRHDEIWPEMVELIHSAGLKNYSIWNTGNQLVEYYECDDMDRASQIVGNSTIKQKWDSYMADILVYNDGNTAVPLDLMFVIE